MKGIASTLAGLQMYLTVHGTYIVSHTAMRLFKRLLCLCAGLQQRQQSGDGGQRQHLGWPAGVPNQGVGPAQLAGRLCRLGARPAAVPVPIATCRWLDLPCLLLLAQPVSTAMFIPHQC